MEFSEALYHLVTITSHVSYSHLHVLYTHLFLVRKLLRKY